jgi:hypothetical protein
MWMSRTPGLRWSGRASRTAGCPLQFFVGLSLVCAIAYTPIHLYLEPHSQGSGVGTGTALAQCGECAVGAAHDGDNHDDRHCVQQHQLVTLPTRALVAERMPVQAMKWVDGHEGFSHARVAGPLGLSPPEFCCSWQFLFRAALPVRAPSLFS